MEKMILSLKNIYMMLMNDDFPIYSESVIGRNERKGYTMLRFWRGCIAEDFRCLPCGKMIWKDNGKRNRYTSYLCNRSAEIKTYSEYSKEIASQVSDASLLHQIRFFEQFLSDRKYKHDILLRRINELIRLTQLEDPRVSPQIADQIRQAAAWQPPGTQGALFQAAYLLTLLTLYAAAGEAMDAPVMTVLLSEEYTLTQLWNTYSQPKEHNEVISYLTVHASLLQDNPLPKHRFFGREEVLFNLKELAFSGGKCLIEGMGGIGKTELLRQLIRICEEERTVDKIAVVPYEGSIIESFARCFPGFARQNPEESFHRVLYRLAKENEQGKVLLLIDNLTNSINEDPDLHHLNTLPCSVMITTRRAVLEGFETCTLDNPSIGTGSLIFRDNYGHPLSPKDQKSLMQLLSDDSLCHPLTLRLMARAARNKSWSVQELKIQLDKKEGIFWQENDRTVRLSQIYRQLYSYSQIPEACRDIVELFTLLPRDSYCLEFMQKWYPDVLRSEPDKKLNALAEGGWLDWDETGYSMHPLIAQCLRRKVISQERICSMFQRVRNRFLEIEYVDPTNNESKDLKRLGDIIVHCSKFLSGSIRKDWMHMLLTAMAVRVNSKQVDEGELQLLSQLMKRCQAQDDLIQIQHCIVLGIRRCGNPEEYSTVYQAQKNKLTVPKPTFLDFCLYAGEALSFMGKSDDAMTLIREVICDDASPFQKANAYFNLIRCCELSGNAEHAIEWAQQGAEFAAGTPQCGKHITFRLLAMLCQLFVKFGRKESAAATLQQIRSQELVQDTPLDQSQYEFVAGLYEMKFGDLEKALSHTQRSMEITEEYEGKKTHYFLHLGQIAGILRAMERYEEALKVYLDLLTYVKENRDEYLTHLYSTNISVVYLALNQPEEALAHLQEAMKLARQQGGIALGEVQRNRARAYELLENFEEEYACLQEAVPLLSAAYGPEHPRAQTARQRLIEVEGMFFNS